MKVAFIVHNFPKLSEGFILNQIQGLIERGHEIEIFAMNNPEEDIEHHIFEEYNLKDKTTYIDYPNNAKGFLKNISLDLLLSPPLEGDLSKLLDLIRKKRFRDILAIGTVVCKKDFDILHFQFGDVTQNMIHLALFSDAKTICSFYGADASRKPKKPDFGGYGELFKEIDTITALSNDMASKLEELGCDSSKIKKIPLCVDTSKFKPQDTGNDISKSNGPPKILTVARFTEKKGIEYAVKALGDIKQDFEYHLIGDGRLRSEIEGLVEEEGIEGNTAFHGWCSNREVRDKMQESDIFLLPSTTAQNGDEEGTPTVLLEAQASELPVVSTYHAGIPEIVKDGETGLLVEERDIQGLKESLIELINDEYKCQRMGKNGRELIKKNHSIGEVAQKLEGVYNRINEIKNTSKEEIATILR